MILVTGTNGFIGSEIVKLLHKKNLSFQIFTGDITNLHDINQYNNDYDTVIHLASIITHKNSIPDNNLYNINVNGTRNLLEKFSDSHFVYISTADVERNNLTEYAESKLISEKLVLGRNINNLVIRLPSIFGAGSKQKKLIPLLLDKYLKDTGFCISNNEEREYMYVEECASLIIDNLQKNGVIRLSGTKIYNTELENIIKDIISGKQTMCVSEHQKLKNNLEDMISKTKEVIL